MVNADTERWGLKLRQIVTEYNTLREGTVLGFGAYLYPNDTVKSYVVFVQTATVDKHIEAWHPDNIYESECDNIYESEG